MRLERDRAGLSDYPVLAHARVALEEIVVHGERGYVSSPTPQSLGEALRRIMDDPADARRMGDAAHAFVSTLTWPGTVRTLTAVD